MLSRRRPHDHHCPRASGHAIGIEPPALKLALRPLKQPIVRVHTDLLVLLELLSKPVSIRTQLPPPTDKDKSPRIRPNTDQPKPIAGLWPARGREIVLEPLPPLSDLTNPLSGLAVEILSRLNRDSRRGSLELDQYPPKAKRVSMPENEICFIACAQPYVRADELCVGTCQGSCEYLRVTLQEGLQRALVSCDLDDPPQVIQFLLAWLPEHTVAS